MPSVKKKKRKEFITTWILEAIDSDESFYQKRMFGGLAAYYKGRMVMLLTENVGEKSYRGKKYKIDLWNGVLLPTERIYHQSLMDDFEGTSPHPVLGKWLYLPAQYEYFETRSVEIAEYIAEGDRRFGIEPKMKAGKKKVK